MVDNPTVSKDIHSRTPPSPLHPPSTCPSPPRFSCYIFFLRVLFGGQPLSPKAVISYLQSRGGLRRCRSSCLSLAFSPKPVLHTRGLLFQNDFRVCGPEGRGSASRCTLTGSEDLLTSSVIPRETPDSEVWCWHWNDSTEKSIWLPMPSGIRNFPSLILRPSLSLTFDYRGNS